jgi:hypothetical protein
LHLALHRLDEEGLLRCALLHLCNLRLELLEFGIAVVGELVHFLLDPLALCFGVLDGGLAALDDRSLFFQLSLDGLDVRHNLPHRQRDL